MRRTMQCKKMGPVDVNGSVTLHTSNIKGKTFQFVRIASCVDWALPKAGWAHGMTREFRFSFQFIQLAMYT